MNEKTRTVLYSVLGTSDPVRNYYDGPMLHIVRRYKPDKVYLFLTKEMREICSRDNRINKTFDHIYAKFGYRPELELIKTDIINPSDTDLVYDAISKEFGRITEEEQDAQYLINLTSGTPQMQFVMTTITLDSKFSCIGIQVANPEGQSGNGGRTNAEDYHIDEQLNNNFDDDSDLGTVNRCSEPKLYAQRCRDAIDRMSKLLARKDYDGAAADTRYIPREAVEMLGHLKKRSSLGVLDITREELADAQKLSNTVGFSLFPGIEPDALTSFKVRNCVRICEYYLLVKKLLLSGSTSEFLIRLNPLIVELQQQLISNIFYGNYRKGINDVMKTVKTPAGDRRMYILGKLGETDPKLADQLKINYAGAEFDKTIFFQNVILKYLKDAFPGSVSEKVYNCLKHAETLNQQERNGIAHDFKYEYNNVIKDVLEIPAGELLKEIEDAICFVFRGICDKKYFAVYDECEKYIRSVCGKEN